MNAEAPQQTSDGRSPPGSPPPPPPPTGPATWYRPQPAAGELTRGWRFVTGLVWGLAFVALIAVWKTSRELGLSTWWLGPLGDPAPVFVSMLPFVAPMAMVLLTVNSSRWIPWAGFAAAAATALVGAGDLGRVTRLGIVELAIAASGLATAVAGFAGRYQRSDDGGTPQPGR